MRDDLQIDERMDELLMLYQASRSVGKSLDIKSVLSEIVTQAIRIVPCRVAILRSVDFASETFLVEAAAAREPFNDSLLAPRSIHEPVREDVLSVPLLHHGQKVGVLEAIGETFTESDERILSILAMNAAEACSRAELYAEAESLALLYMRKNAELSILNQISREIQGKTSREEILYVILTGITSGHGFGYNRAVALLLDESHPRRLRGAYGIGATYEAVTSVWSEATERFRTLGDYFKSLATAARQSSPFNELVKTLDIALDHPGSFFARAIDERRGFSIPNARDLLGADRDFAMALRSAAFALVPIYARVNATDERQRVLGVLAVDNCFTRKPIGDDDLVLLETVANQCGLALATADLIDDLGGAMSKLEETTERLLEAERYAAIGEVAAGVAHDIRNPLTSIGGFTRRIGKRLPPGDMGHTYVEIVEKEVRRLEHLAAEVLELATDRKPKFQDVDIIELVREWKMMHEPEIRDKQITFVVDSAPLMTVADPWLLSRAVSNVLLNATDAVEKYGRIACRGISSESAVTLVVEDNGPGIEPEKIEQIFEPFYTTKTEGTGLGLSLAKKAMLVHGGHIAVTSTPGEGTTMRLILPK